MIRLNLLVALASALATGPAAAQSKQPPGPGERIAPGVVLHEAELINGNRLWVYLPERRPKSLPCVFIAPAGSRMFHGMELAAGDRPEHVPYARAGFAVVAYEVSGAVDEAMTERQLMAAIRGFKRARAGIEDGKAAITWAMKHLPGLDRDRLYAVGHSSAGTLSLQLAQHDQRIDACVAFAPVTDVIAHLTGSIRQLEDLAKGYSSLVATTDPTVNVKKLRCPTLLFCAKDDELYDDVLAFGKTLEKTNPKTTVAAVPEGGHYEPMIDPGIPTAMKWLLRLDAAARPGK